MGQFEKTDCLKLVTSGPQLRFFQDHGLAHEGIQPCLDCRRLQEEQVAWNIFGAEKSSNIFYDRDGDIYRVFPSGFAAPNCDDRETQEDIYEEILFNLAFLNQQDHKEIWTNEYESHERKNYCGRDNLYPVEYQASNLDDCKQKCASIAGCTGFHEHTTSYSTDIFCRFKSSDPTVMKREMNLADEGMLHIRRIFNVTRQQFNNQYNGEGNIPFTTLDLVTDFADVENFSFKQMAQKQEINTPKNESITDGFTDPNFHAKDHGAMDVSLFKIPAIFFFAWFIILCGFGLIRERRRLLHPKKEEEDDDEENENKVVGNESEGQGGVFVEERVSDDEGVEMGWGVQKVKDNGQIYASGYDSQVTMLRSDEEMQEVNIVKRNKSEGQHYTDERRHYGGSSRARSSERQLLLHMG